MRVLIVNTSERTGGAAIAANRLKDALNNSGVKTMMLVTDKETDDITVAALPHKWLLQWHFLWERWCLFLHLHFKRRHLFEVDMANSWTNMGWQPIEKYVDRYVKSMRLCYNIVRQYDQNAFVLGSYSHSWTEGSEGNMYTTKEMIELEQEYSNAEGDFKWGIAYHPYPYNLLKPAFWKDDVKRATFDMNTPYVTFRNPEVISAWITA